MYRQSQEKQSSSVSARMFDCSSPKDLITAQQHAQAFAPQQTILLHDLKYANQSPIVKSSSNQMYSIGTTQRFPPQMSNTDVAFYAKQGDPKKPNSARGFTRGPRDTIISYGITDNPCNKYYDNVKTPNVKQTKSFGSGPPRFSDITPLKKSESPTRSKNSRPPSVVDNEKHLVHTHRVNPKISFPNTTTRVFADISHKIPVPSPDSYFKRDHLRRETGSEYGLAYHAQKDSNHKSIHAVKMSHKPARFDPYIDLKSAKRPGPTSYSPKDVHRKNPKSCVSARAKATRMKPDRYHTDAPGTGTYRMQSEFGIYSASDTYNHFNVNLLSRAQSTSRLNFNSAPSLPVDLSKTSSTFNRTATKPEGKKPGSRHASQSTRPHSQFRETERVEPASTMVKTVYTKMQGTPCHTSAKKHNHKRKNSVQLSGQQSRPKTSISTKKRQRGGLSSSKRNEETTLFTASPENNRSMAHKRFMLQTAGSGSFSQFLSKTQRSMLFKQTSN